MDNFACFTIYCGFEFDSWQENLFYYSGSSVVCGGEREDVSE